MFWEDIIKDISFYYCLVFVEYSFFIFDMDGFIWVFIGVDWVDFGLMLVILVDIWIVYGKLIYKE